MIPMPLSSTLVGRTLGGFLIQGQLGSGGMGVVYRAHDERLNRTVAVKVLHPKFTADTELRERFVREGRTAALIDHPNVVRVISAGEEDGIPYLVMEYVEGGTLDRMLERPECLSVARCLRIAKQLAEALASAHRVGVMHRDVKPANVLFTNAGEPKLADFGLAREEAGDHNLSQTGILLGTPHYMSPEACEGRHGDARSDIYSLGVLLYAMLEKRLPFQGDSQAGILIAQIQAPVPPLTQAPAALKQVVYKALEKKAADRWASASEFAAALERVLEEIYLPPSQWTGGATPVRGNGASRHSSGPTEAIHPAAKADGLAATVFRGKRSSRRRRLIGASTVAVLLVAGVFLAPSFRRRGNVSTPSTAGELAAMPPVSSSTDIVPDPPVSAVTNLTIGPPDFVAGGPDDSDEEFKRVSQKAETLESFGEFLAAMAAWTEFQPTSRKAQFALELARKELRERSAARVKRELALKPRGAKAAADLRILATRFPEPESLRLLAAAAEADKGWTAADGLDGLRYGFVHHDCASLLAEIDAAGTGVSADDKSRIESARNSVRRLGLMLDRSFAWYRSHRGTVIDAQRTDGSAVHGTIQTVDEAARLVYIETPGALVNLSSSELSTAELVGRALQDNPPDEVLLAALDLLILAGDSPEAWPVALRVRRRGLCIEPDREELSFLRGRFPRKVPRPRRLHCLNLSLSAATQSGSAPLPATGSGSTGRCRWIRSMWRAPGTPCARGAASRARRMSSCAARPACRDVGRRSRSTTVLLKRSWGTSTLRVLSPWYPGNWRRSGRPRSPRCSSSRDSSGRKVSSKCSSAPLRPSRCSWAGAVPRSVLSLLSARPVTGELRFRSRSRR
ncbi:MAG: serine/threonine protein kinase [Planctomycetes bacterium]|nr:serine/threonine protein kinase [Planctomycetota bacterium]